MAKEANDPYWEGWHKMFVKMGCSTQSLAQQLLLLRWWAQTYLVGTWLVFTQVHTKVKEENSSVLGQEQTSLS